MSELTKLKNEQLIEKRQELKINMVSCHKGINPKYPTRLRGNLRKEIARIETEITRRKNLQDNL